MFVVRCPTLHLQILRFAQNDRDCHHRRSRRRSEGSGVPHWFSTLAATGDFKGDMHPDDATGSVYHGSPAHISRPPLCLGLCQGGRFLFRYWQMEKVEEQIPSWGIAVLCAEASVRQRLCAQAPCQGMQFRTAFGTDLLGEETPCQGFIQFLCFHRLFFLQNYAFL